VKTIHVARGKSITHIDVKKDAPAADELAAKLLGPTGNLKAPTLKSGTAMLVGFNAEMYEEVLG
jgi:arsenate reductase-like glutaredoxin family protein